MKPKEALPNGGCQLASQEKGRPWPLQAEGWARTLSKGSPHPGPRPGDLGRGSYLSDEDSANLLVLPAEGGEELVVSGGETTVIAGAAAWVGRGGP